jgi:hypothetical protein
MWGSSEVNSMKFSWKLKYICSAACTIQQLITLNYASYDIRPIAIFLTLFPVFTLSSNFPLIAITLRNNLMILIPYGQSHPQLRQIAFALLATGNELFLSISILTIISTTNCTCVCSERCITVGGNNGFVCWIRHHVHHSCCIVGLFKKVCIEYAQLE